eukprot:6212523-Pleurochrysis_carterae.AAC.2
MGMCLLQDVHPSFSLLCLAVREVEVAFAEGALKDELSAAPCSGVGTVVGGAALLVAQSVVSLRDTRPPRSITASVRMGVHGSTPVGFAYGLQARILLHTEDCIVVHGRLIGRHRACQAKFSRFGLLVSRCNPIGMSLSHVDAQSAGEVSCNVN